MAGQSVGHDSWPRSGPRLREGGEVTSVSLAGVLTLEPSQPADGKAGDPDAHAHPEPGPAGHTQTGSTVLTVK